MGRNTQNWKKGVRWALALLLAFDVVLVFVNLRNGGVEAQAHSLDDLMGQHAIVSKDVRHAQDIEQRLPKIRKDCDGFFKDRLRSAEDGYSAVVADLGAIASQAGLRDSAVSYRQKPVENRGVVEVDIGVALEGDYASLVRFINGLERSKSFYTLDRLSLTSGTSGGIKLNLELRTYFRSQT